MLLRTSFVRRLLRLSDLWKQVGPRLAGVVRLERRPGAVYVLQNSSVKTWKLQAGSFR